MTEDTIKQAFSSVPQLHSAVKRAIETTPEHITLFDSIAAFIVSLQAAYPDDGPSNKRRRTDLPSRHLPAKSTSNGINQNKESDLAPIEEATLLLSLKDPLSFLLPARKKLSLILTETGIIARHPTSAAVEASVRWPDIQRVLLLPLPERPQPHTVILVFPPNATGLTQASDSNTPLVFLLPTNLPLSSPAPTGSGATSFAPQFPEDATIVNLLRHVIGHHLLPGVRIMAPDEDIFQSTIPQPTGETALFTKAFLGSKEGWLYLLEDALVFGFKKPVLWLAVERVTGWAVVNVLGRTFDIEVVIRTETSESEVSAETEQQQTWQFGMIDQRDFEAVDKWVKRVGVEDGSFREGRKAKIVDVDGKMRRKGIKGEEAEGEANPDMGGDGVSGEPARGLEERTMDEEDDEDEEGEDYDPGSEGESEGSATSSDGDDDDGVGEKGEKDGMGSEADEEL